MPTEAELDAIIERTRRRVEQEVSPVEAPRFRRRRIPLQEVAPSESYRGGIPNPRRQPIRPATPSRPAQPKARPQSRRRARQQPAAQAPDVVERPAAAAPAVAIGPPDIDLEEASGAGAPLLDRLVGAFKFDQEGTLSYLKAQYGEDSAFIGADDNLYFLPPVEAQMPPQQQEWVRFDPDGFDVGDVADVVPAAIAIAAGVGAASLSAGLSVPATAGALFAGGAAGDVVGQAIGAALPGDEPTATPGRRVARAATSGAFELGGAAAGAAVSRAVPAAARRVSDAGRRALERFAKGGARSEQVASRQALGERVFGDGAQFTQGQLTGDEGILLPERFLRQHLFTAGVFKDAEERQLTELANFAERRIARISSGGVEGSVEAATQAHREHLQQLSKQRSRTFGRLFAKAQKSVGDERIVPLDNTRQAIESMIEREASDAPTSDSVAAMEFLRDRLGELPSGQTTIRRMQNMLRDWGAKSYDPRGVVEKIADPSLQKNISRNIMRGLQKDLQAASDALVTRAAQSGQFKNADKLREAAQNLMAARRTYRRFSQVIQSVADNPLASRGINTDKLMRTFLSSGRDLTEARKVMTFLNTNAKATAAKVRGEVLDEILRGARRGDANAPISPALLRNITSKASRKLDVLFAGDSVARSSFRDAVDASKILADYGKLLGAQTAPLQIVENTIRLVGGPALAGSAFFSGANPSDLTEETGLIVLSIFSSRWLARSLTNPRMAKNYSKLMVAPTKRISNPGAMRGVRQAVVDIIGFNTRRDAIEASQDDGAPMPERPDDSLPSRAQITDRAMQFSPAGI